MTLYHTSRVLHFSKKKNFVFMHATEIAQNIFARESLYNVDYCTLRSIHVVACMYECSIHLCMIAIMIMMMYIVFAIKIKYKSKVDERRTTLYNAKTLVGCWRQRHSYSRTYCLFSLSSRQYIKNPGRLAKTIRQIFRSRNLFKHHSTQLTDSDEHSSVRS